jgi:hypothetical protein
MLLKVSYSSNFSNFGGFNFQTGYYFSDWICTKQMQPPTLVGSFPIPPVYFRVQIILNQLIANFFALALQ